MNFDIGKIIDFLQPSYNQLKTILIISLSIIGFVYLLGAKTASFQTSLEQTKINTENNHIAIKENFSKIEEMEENIDTKMNILFNDIIELNKLNNQYNDKKINLLLKYGNKNKDLLLELMEVQNQEQKIYEENKLKEMKYKQDKLNDIKEKNSNIPDSLKIVVKKKEKK